MAMSAGLGTSVLAGQSSADDALAIIRYHLDWLLAAPPLDVTPGQSTAIT